MRIGIVGTGISGLAAASRLRTDHEITVFESESRIGGHAHTVDVDTPEGSVAVDTGFIVYNDDNYPGFRSLLNEYHVETQATEMSFGVNVQGGPQYRGSNANTFFAQRRNIASFRHWRMLLDIARFNRQAARLVADEPPWAGADRLPGPGIDASESIADFLKRGKYGTEFVNRFLIPFGSAIWSVDPGRFAEFPVRSYARFMANHGLLGVTGRKQWRTVAGGSREYVQRLTAPFADRIHVNAGVTAIDELGGQTLVRTRTGEHAFDAVVIATHSDTALNLLTKPTESETDILGAIRFTPNVATLHSDTSIMPSNQRAWASWNYHVGQQGQGASVTYWMNQLQHLATSRPLFVSLNRQAEITPSSVHGQWTYQHPEFDVAAMAAQRRRREIQGRRGRWYAGAYWGYGFHEDGVQSGFEVARQINLQSSRSRIVLAA